MRIYTCTTLSKKCTVLQAMNRCGLFYPGKESQTRSWHFYRLFHQSKWSQTLSSSVIPTHTRTVRFYLRMIFHPYILLFLHPYKLLSKDSSFHYISNRWTHQYFCFYRIDLAFDNHVCNVLWSREHVQLWMWTWNVRRCDRTSSLGFLPWQPLRSWVSPGDPTVSSSCPGSRCYQTLPLPPSPSLSLPPSAVPHSSALFSGGNGPGSKTPGRSHQYPSSLTPGQTTGRTSPPSCATCLCGKSSKWRWRPPGADRRSIRSRSGCSRHRFPSGTRGCCTLEACQAGSWVADPGSATGLHGSDPRR